MANANSKAASRPDKPRPDFPLFAHANGQWAKKARGKIHFFGVWRNPEAALNAWLDQKDDLLAGRVPRKKSGDITLRDLCNRFLTAKQARVDSGELTARAFKDLHGECERLLDYFGRDRFADDFQPEDFEQYRAHLAKGRSAKTLDNLINRQRSIFRWGYRNRLLKAPTEFGDSFNRPSRDTLARERARKGERLFAAEQIRAMLDRATVAMRAMILLGVGNGLGNADIGRLEFRHLDLAAGWLTYPRPKTGARRRSKLWPETIAALESWLEKRKAWTLKRPANAEHRELVFLTRTRKPFFREGHDGIVTRNFERMLSDLDIRQPGLTFYALRHTYRTIADDSLDQPAIALTMGHTDASMAGNYRQRIRDERLEAVAKHVHDWLFGKAVAK